MSVPNKIRKWVVEKFDGISPGLIDTHIVRFCEKIAFFQIWGQRALGPKIWPRGPNCLKYDCWGPGKSIDPHIMGPVENIPGTEAKMAKNCKFLNLGPNGLWTQNLAPGSKL